jgi:8-oxo-dGTP diphosphatase
MNEKPLVILTALDLEYAAVRKTLTDLEVHWHPAGTRFEVGRLASGGSPVVLGLTGKGNQHAAVLAERAISEFDPLVLLFVGVAGGLWSSVALGDVVVATHIYAYHGGTSEDDGLKARPRVWEISHESDQIARHLARDGGWAHALPPGHSVPKVHFGPIAAGEIVQDSAVSEHARWVRQTYNDALAIEMEGAGVAQAAHLNRSLPVVVIRGVSDRADGTKLASDGAQWQPRAVANAATFAIALANDLMTNLRSDRVATGVRPAYGTPTSSTTTNIATGNARVGIQAGHFYGNVTIGAGDTDEPDLGTQIADLRGGIERARKTRELDEVTFAAASQELAAVEAALPAAAPDRKDRLMIALKRLRGLVADVAELATQAAAIMAVVRGLS